MILFLKIKYFTSYHSYLHKNVLQSQHFKANIALKNSFTNVYTFLHRFVNTQHTWNKIQESDNDEQDFQTQKKT